MFISILRTLISQCSRSLVPLLSFFRALCLCGNASKYERHHSQVKEDRGGDKTRYRSASSQEGCYASRRSKLQGWYQKGQNVYVVLAAANEGRS